MNPQFFKVDLHNHTIFSYDAAITFKDLKKAYQEGKFDVIAITDHNTIKGAKEVAAANVFPTIVGEEITTKKGEVIGLFLKKEIPPYLPLKETVQRIKKQGGLVYIPHPFNILHLSLREKVLLEILPEIDILETHNGGFWTKKNIKKAEDFAKKHNLLTCACSDAHTALALGRCFLKIPKDKLHLPLTAEKLMQALIFAKPVDFSLPIFIHVLSGLRGYLSHRLFRKKF